MITITPDPNNKTVLTSISKAVNKVRRGLRSGLIEIGRENVKHLRALIKNPPKTGRFYGKHQASASGEAPANWTGRLMRSVSYRMHGHDQMEFGETAFYGKFLEDGTEKMAARPHVIRTVKEKSKDNYNSLDHTVDRIIKR